MSQMTFEAELQSVINRYSRENDSNTPDYILAEYMADCLGAFNRAIRVREKWYGRDPNTGPAGITTNPRTREGTDSK